MALGYLIMLKHVEPCAERRVLQKTVRQAGGIGNLSKSNTNPDIMTNVQAVKIEKERCCSNPRIHDRKKVRQHNAQCQNGIPVPRQGG